MTEWGSTCAPHRYQDAAAAVGVVTPYGTYLMCEPCGAYFLGKGIASQLVQLSPSLVTRNGHRCQCEHERHFGAVAK